MLHELYGLRFKTCNTSNLQPINTLHCNTSTLNASRLQCFNASLLQCFNASTLQCFNASYLQCFKHASTFQRQKATTPFNPLIIQHSKPLNHSTLQLINSLMLKSFNASTCQAIKVYFITSKLQLSGPSGYNLSIKNCSIEKKRMNND